LPTEAAIVRKEENYGVYVVVLLWCDSGGREKESGF